MTAVADPVAPPPVAAPPVAGRRARIDAGIRAAATAGLWLSLLLVTYWWIAGGGIQDLDELGERADVARSVDRPDRLGPAAGAGPADGAHPGRRARRRAGPAGRLHRLDGLHLVHPDARPHRADHLGVRRGRARRGARRRSGTSRRPTPACCSRSAGTLCLVWSSSPASGPRAPAALRVVAPAAPLRLPRRRPRPAAPAVDRPGVPRLHRPPPSTGGRCGARPPRRCSSGGSGCRCSAAAPRPARHVGGARGPTASSRSTSPGATCTACRSSAGQFLNWRFLTGRGWTRAHPYSLSAAPDGRSLRITVKALGDGSALVRALRPGTRVLVEGPYGRLTERARTRAKVAFIGAGVGITPLRALAEALRLRAGRRRAAAARDRPAAVRARARRARPRARACRCCWLPGRRRSPDSWLGDGVAGRRPHRCCRTGCRTSPSATSTSAVRRSWDGRRPPHPARRRPARRAVPRRELRVVTGMRRIALWFLEHR